MLSDDKRRVLIVEPSGSGHRLYFVRLVVETALERGHKVGILTTAETLLRPEWTLHLGAVLDRVSIVTSPVFRLRNVTRQAIAFRADHVVIPDGDRMAVAIGLRGCWEASSTLTALVLRDRDQHSNLLSRTKGALKRFLVWRASQARRVTVCQLKSPFWVGRTSMQIARDPVTLAAMPLDTSYLESLNLDKTKYWFGILGAISARKNLSLVAEALARLNKPELGLLVAGRFSEDVRAELPAIAGILEASGVTVRFLDELLPDASLDELVQGVDCVVLAHSNEGSSGIMGKAAVAGTRVVASGARSLREDCESIPKIASWAPLDVSELSTLLGRAAGLDRPEPFVGPTSRDFASVLL